MIFNWLRRRRRKRILAQPFPTEWERVLAANVCHDRQLSQPDRQRLRRRIQVFVAEKNWEGCGGLPLTDEIKVTIAAQASLLVLGVARMDYDHVLSILVYPTAYLARQTQTSSVGIETVGDQPRMGEAWWRGPVILSWADVLAGSRMEQPGRNVVLHEFSHQIDMMNGRFVDGTPPLPDRSRIDRWIHVIQPAFEQLQYDCRHRRFGVIDCYGATNAGEFFAVITEAFFESPQQLRHQHADIYTELANFYQLNPAEWPPITHAADDFGHVDEP